MFIAPIVILQCSSFELTEGRTVIWPTDESDHRNSDSPSLIPVHFDCDPLQALAAAALLLVAFLRQR